MGKMTSLLEKYKLIEKEEDPSSLTDLSHTNEASQNETPQEVPKMDLDTASSSYEPESKQPEQSITSTDSEEPTSESSLNYTSSETSLNHTDSKSSSNQIASEAISKEESTPTVNYNQLLTIDEVYNYLELNQLAATDTVFLLENLIKALPEELPEFVKKTTVHNIIQASAMNLPKLLEDGHIRSQSLKEFSTNYVQAHSEDITTLKTEIARLSAIIADYHQQIKNKETLIAEETSLIQTEQYRIQSILEFFNN